MENKKNTEALSAPEGLKLLITIVNRVKSEYYADLIQSRGVNMQLFVSAEGTAGSETLTLMGLGDDRKSVIMGVVRASKAPEIMALLTEKFKTIKNGKGVAFTVPLTSVIGVSTYRFLSDDRDTQRFL